MTNEERKVFELALEALLKTQNEGFNLPGSAIREAIIAIKEALAQPDQDQDEVDIRSRLYQRIHELETQLAQQEQEPVAVIGSGFQLLYCRNDWSKGLKVGDKLYTTPPQRQPLKYEEYSALAETYTVDYGLLDCVDNHLYKPLPKKEGT